MKNVKVLKGKQGYSNKGSVPFKAVSEAPKKTKASSTPGMGKGKQEEWALLNLVVSFLVYIKCQFFGCLNS